MDSRIYFILQEEKVKEKQWGKYENGTTGKTELQEKNKIWFLIYKRLVQAKELTLL